MSRLAKPKAQRSGVPDVPAGRGGAVAGPSAAPASESFYRALIEQTSDLVSVVDADNVFRFASPSHLQILGYHPEELIGRSAFDFIRADDLAALRERFRLAASRTGQTTSGPYHFRHADGSWCTLEAVGTNLLGDPSVSGIVINARDVTLRVKVDEALAAQRRQLGDQLAELDLLYRTAPVGLGLVDPMLRFVRVNDRLASFNGPTPEEHVGRLPREILGELGERLEGVCREIIETGQPAIGLALHAATPALTGVEKDWLVYYHRLDDADGRPLGVSAVVQDITELKDAERALKQAHDELDTRVRLRTAELLRVNDALRAGIADRERAEAELRRSEERYRHLVENINEVIFTVEPGGCITYISPAMERVTGRAPAEVVGHSFLEFVHPDDAPALGESFQRLLGGRPEASEYRVLDKDGQIRWVRSQSQTVVKDGRVVAVQGVLTDLTARHHAEMDARQRREELAHVQRLTTAGEMTAEIAHQINQPLAAIVNFAAGLAARLRDGKVEPSMGEVADRIADQARRAAEVIRRLRAFLRKGDGVVRRDCDLNQLVTRVYGLLEEDFRREGVEVHLRLDPAVPEFALDPILIEQVILNLLRNAIDAMAERSGGVRRMDVATAVEQKMVRVTVKDTGIGLPVGREAEIFEAFFTTKPEGLGLGLSVSRSIIEASGGRLWAERDADGGTTVGFALPLATAPQVLTKRLHPSPQRRKSE